MDFEAFNKLTYGLYIVSSQNGEKKNGFVANAVFQVTSQPPQIAVACNKDNFTSQLIEKSKVFSISVLKKDANPKLFGLFGFKSGSNVDKFESVNHITAITGAPIVTDESIAWFDCKLINSFNVGTHIIFIGQIEDSGMLSNEDEPFLYSYYRTVKRGKAPKNAPTFIVNK